MNSQYQVENESPNSISELINTYDPPVAVSELIDTLIDNWLIFREDEKNGDASLVQYLKENQNEMNFDLMIDTLNMCFCCSRHETNKPEKLEPYFETEYKNCGLTQYLCNCKCRQITRAICRAKFGYCYPYCCPCE